jgi:hypothetical protein
LTEALASDIPNAADIGNQTPGRATRGFNDSSIDPCPARGLALDGRCRPGFSEGRRTSRLDIGRARQDGQIHDASSRQDAGVRAEGCEGPQDAARLVRALLIERFSKRELAERAGLDQRCLKLTAGSHVRLSTVLRVRRLYKLLMVEPEWP